jgi:NAD dependent epimerase/dehydratase
MRKLGRVFVTGAGGFIGSHLTERLIGDGLEVTALCQYNSSGSYGWLNKYGLNPPKNLSLLLGDVRDPFFVSDAIKDHQTVFHLASLIAIPFSYTAPRSYIDSNIIGTTNLARACLDNKVELLVHTSTSEVYGTAQYVPIDEKHPLQGQSPYSATKIGADMLVESFVRSFGLPAITLRPFNTFGERQSTRAVIPTIISQVAKSEGPIKLGNTSPTRDFNYVGNTVDAFIAIGRHARSDVYGQVFNAGSGREIAISDLAPLIAKLLNKPVEIQQDEQRVRPEQSEVERLLCNYSKIKDFCGWTPAVDLESGLKRVIAWYLDNPAVWNPNRYHV